MNEHEDIFDPQKVTKKTFSSSYFLKEPLETVESIVIRLEEINVERIQEGSSENNPSEDMQIIMGDAMKKNAGDDKKYN